MRGNEIFGGISFPRKIFSFGKDSVGVGGLAGVKYAVALFQISPSILFGVHSPLPNSKSLHSSLWTVAKELSQTGFSSLLFNFLDENVMFFKFLFPTVYKQGHLGAWVCCDM